MLPPLDLDGASPNPADRRDYEHAADSPLANQGSSNGSSPGVAPENTASASAVRPPHEAPTSQAGRFMQARNPEILRFTNELPIEIVERLPHDCVAALGGTSQRFHSEITRHLLANTRFDVALRAESLDLRRAHFIITESSPGSSRFAYANLSRDAQQARVDDVVRAAMTSPKNHSEGVFDHVRRFLTETIGVASLEQVTLRAAQFVSSAADILLVLGKRRAPLYAVSTKRVGPLFDLLIGRAALTSSWHERTKMLEDIRKFDADLGERIFQDIEKMIQARPCDGKIPASARALIDEFRVRANEEIEIPSPGDIDTRRALDGNVRQIAFLAYWLDCLGHPDLLTLIDLPKAERWLVIEDYAADVNRYPHEVETLAVGFAKNVRPISTAREVSAALGTPPSQPSQGSVDRQQALLRIVGDYVSRMAADQREPAMVKLRSANQALAVHNQIDVEAYRAPL